MLLQEVDVGVVDVRGHDTNFGVFQELNLLRFTCTFFHDY